MTIEQFLAQFGIKREVNAVRVGRSYFIVKDKALLAKNPVFCGECIAHERGPVLIPSIDFLQEIGKAARRHVVVNKDGEWLFICGRDIFGKSIVSHNNPALGDMVVVLNSHKECIGYGTLVADITEKKVVVKRLFDIGDLLRRERKARKVKG